MKKPELKPCPLCKGQGKQNVKTHYDDDGCSIGESLTKPSCTNCGLTMPSAEAWNNARR